MKLHMIYLLSLLYCAFSYGQEVEVDIEGDSIQVAKHQQLLDLLTANDYFGAKELYGEMIKEFALNDFIHVYYQSRITNFENRTDSAIYYLEKVVTDFPDTYFATLPIHYQYLASLYQNQQEYKKELELGERLQRFIKKNPFKMDEDSLATWRPFLKERKPFLKSMLKSKKIRIERTSKPDYIKLKDGDHITFDVRYNGKEMHTMFDTGVTSHLVVEKQLAMEMGINLSDSDSITINGKKMHGGNCILDSLEFANIRLYNIPAIVYDYDVIALLPDSIMRDSTRRQKLEDFKPNLQVVIGLPIMLLLKRHIVDFGKKVIEFPETSEEITSKPNFFLWEKGLYAQIKVNEIPFTGHFDTGSDSYIDIDSLFYDKHKDQIALDAIAVKKPLNKMLVDRYNLDIPYEIPKDMKVEFENRQINYLPADTIQIYNLKPTWGTSYFNGVIGNAFVKSLGNRILIDFEKMRIDVIGEEE